MAKHVTIPIDATLDLKLRLYAAHKHCTKAEAANRALRDGIPDWVMAVPPSEVRSVQADDAGCNYDDLSLDDDEEAHHG